jgi:hypothetical protein
MPNWKRIIIGDAFKVAPGGFNHYRDLFLVWPFLLFSIIAISNIFASGPAERLHALRAGLCAVAAILLAKERLPLFMAALFYVAVRLLGALILLHDWKVLLGALLSCALFVVLIRSRTFANWKPSYATEKGQHSLDIVVTVGGLLFALAIAIWINP